MTQRRRRRAQRSPLHRFAPLLLLSFLAASCVLSEVTIGPLRGDGGTGGTTPDNGGTGGKSAAAGSSNETTTGGDAGADGSGASSSAGASTAGTSTAGASQGGVSSGGSPSSGGQPEGEGGEAGARPVIDPNSGPFKVLVVSATAGFVHSTIPDAVALVDELGKTLDISLPAGAKPGSQFETTVLGSPSALDSITPAFLADYRVLFFAHTTGELFSVRSNGPQIMDAIEAFMNEGGGFVGINGTLDLETTGTWPWVQDNLTGSLPATHTTAIADDVLWLAAAKTADHPIIRGIESPWACIDEWYTLARHPNAAGFSVLGIRDESSAPVVWVKAVGAGGRSVFTSLGHAPGTYGDDNFKRLILQSILWAARRMD